MNQVVPPSFLFQHSLTIPRISSLPRKKKGHLLQLPPEANLFVPAVLNGPTDCLKIRMAWNPQGLGICVQVTGRKIPATGRSGDLKNSDHFQLMIDTRRTAEVHRATAWCTSLIILPVDEKSGGQPTALSHDISQQKERRQAADASGCLLRTDLHKDGYLTEVWIPAELLPGFSEIGEIGQLGFYCVVRDTELGELPLSVGGDFPVTFDPSTWIEISLSA